MAAHSLRRNKERDLSIDCGCQYHGVFKMIFFLKKEVSLISLVKEQIYWKDGIVSRDLREFI